MTLNGRQALTSALVGGVAAVAVEWLLHGRLDSAELMTALFLGVAVGAARLMSFGGRI